MYSVFNSLLESRGVTAYAVSKATGISTATLSDWKNGRSTPKTDKLQKIADYFGVSLDYLTGAETNTNDIQMDDFTFAMHGESRRLSDRDKSILLKMAREMAAATEEEMQNGNTD